MLSLLCMLHVPIISSFLSYRRKYIECRIQIMNPVKLFFILLLFSLSWVQILFSENYSRIPLMYGVALVRETNFVAPTKQQKLQLCVFRFLDVCIGDRIACVRLYFVSWFLISFEACIFPAIISHQRHLSTRHPVTNELCPLNRKLQFPYVWNPCITEVRN
jgi:hypothetical protein